MKRVALLLRRNVFYESEIRKQLEQLIRAYEPHRLPASYMGDIVVMTHAVRSLLLYVFHSFSARLCWLRR